MSRQPGVVWHCVVAGRFSFRWIFLRHWIGIRVPFKWRRHYAWYLHSYNCDYLCFELGFLRVNVERFRSREALAHDFEEWRKVDDYFDVV